MSDCPSIKIVVEVQENGIIRDINGHIIARLSAETEYKSLPTTMDVNVEDLSPKEAQKLLGETVAKYKDKKIPSESVPYEILKGLYLISLGISQNFTGYEVVTDAISHMQTALNWVINWGEKNAVNPQGKDCVTITITDVIDRVYNWKCMSAYQYASEIKDKIPPEAYCLIAENARTYGDCGWNTGKTFDVLEQRCNKIIALLQK